MHNLLWQRLQSADRTKMHPKAKVQNAPTFNGNGSHCHVCLLLVIKIKTCTYQFCKRQLADTNYRPIIDASLLITCILHKTALYWYVPCVCSPKCRHEYSQKDCPRQYRCYCGKVVDPVFDPWLIPHSCGQECGRPLRPDCGHTCHLLCHPGDQFTVIADTRVVISIVVHLL